MFAEAYDSECREVRAGTHYGEPRASHRSDWMPALAIELDGPFHKDSDQIIRDRAKNVLCASVSLPLLRLPVQAADRRERMTALTWLAKQFPAYTEATASLRRDAMMEITSIPEDLLGGCGEEADESGFEC